MRRIFMAALAVLFFPSWGVAQQLVLPVCNSNAPCFTAANPGAVTATISGTISENVAQFGGSAVVTGTGVSGAGIPRVTISSDSSLAANQSVNLAQVAGATTATGNGTAAGSLRVALPTDGTGVVGLIAGSAIIGKVGIDQTTPGTTNLVAAGQNGTWTVQPGNTANTTAWLVTSTPSAASGAGLTPVSSSALAANTVIKASAGNLSSFTVSADSTLSAAAWWIMIYNATSAPVDGAVTPAKCYAMPSGTTGFSAAFTTPIAFSTGITIGVSSSGCFSKTASTHAFISGDAI